MYFAIDLVCYTENQLRFVPKRIKKLDNVNSVGSSLDLTLPYGVITAIVRDDCVHDA